MAKILIVDDDATTRKLLKHIFSKGGEGYVIIEANSGMAALEMIEKDRPDIILLDILMPAMDGFEVCRELKADTKYKDIPILFITAVEETRDKIRGFQMGAADYITKPINPEELKARVAAHLRIKWLENERVELEKLRTVKDMIATYNHNMNQPLTAAYAYIGVLAAKMKKDDRESRTIGNIKKELDKVKSILQKIQSIDKVKRTNYVGDAGMIKLEKAPKDIKESEAQIMHAGKITAMGKMSAGVAHEMNQPLMAISTHIETLLMNEVVCRDEKLKDKINKIKEQFNRLGSIVQRVSDYSKTRSGAMVNEDINIPVKDSLLLLNQQLKDHNIELSLELDEKTPKIYIDRYYVQDVVINFLVNARDAIDDVYHEKPGGRVKIFSKMLKDAGAVCVGVIDNGKPIEAGTEEKLFSPFFTTKGSQDGTGLGLAISRNIIKNHRGIIGFIRIEDKKLFYFALPLDKDRDLADDETLMRKIEAELKGYD